MNNDWEEDWEEDEPELDDKYALVFLTNDLYISISISDIRNRNIYLISLKENNIFKDGDVFDNRKKKEVIHFYKGRFEKLGIIFCKLDKKYIKDRKINININVSKTYNKFIHQRLDELPPEIRNNII